MDTLGERIRKLRVDHGMTQKELAKRVGMSQANLSDLENNTFPSSSYLPQIAKTFNVDSYWLATGIGLPRKNTINEPDPPPYHSIIDSSAWQALSPKTRALIEELMQSGLDDKDVKALKDYTDLLKLRTTQNQQQEMTTGRAKVPKKKSRNS